jgi:hypothetical protein
MYILIANFSILLNVLNDNGRIWSLFKTKCVRTTRSGQPILRVAIAQLATYKIFLARNLRCQSRSEHIKFNYVESPYMTMAESEVYLKLNVSEQHECPRCEY